MSVVGFIPDPKSAATVVSWTRALAGEGTVSFLCRDRWSQSKTLEAVRAVLGEPEAAITTVDAAEPVGSIVQYCRGADTKLLVTCAFSYAGHPGQDSEALIHAAPCLTFVGLYGDKPADEVRKALVILSGDPQDQALLDLVGRRGDTEVTVAVIEEDIGTAAEDVGRRELERTLREADLHEAEHVEGKVVVDNHPIRGVLRCFDDHDLVLVGLDQAEHLKPLEDALQGAIGAVAKREPPLSFRGLPAWMPRLNPADYARLAQELRAGSRWRADFILMLATASAIASLGLVQNSPAVVIGSMLLAPLMTPMIGLGLSLAQANPRLGETCLGTIGRGILLTLTVSLALGLAIPSGELLSPETLARGAPNLLDLMIALFAAVAASFALARPGITGAIAGVAIATALVPPLCSVGISLAYKGWVNAFGAAALFATNLVAIILASSVTFLLMGVTSANALPRFRRIVRFANVGLVILLLSLTIPLGAALESKIDEGSERPLAFPVRRTVARAVHARVEREPGARVMFLARGAVAEGVVIYVASETDIPRNLAEDLTKIVRERMDDDKLPVHVFAVRLAWRGS